MTGENKTVEPNKGNLSGSLIPRRKKPKLKLKKYTRT